MKLDLMNSRIPVNLGPRIYDSIEGENIQHPSKNPKVLSKASFKSKQIRIDYGPKKEKIPDRFNLSVVDSHGTYLPLDKTKRFKPKNSIPLTKPETFHDHMKKSSQPIDPLGVEKFPSKITDYMKDRIYAVKEDTVENRIRSKTLPGAFMDGLGRKATPPKSHIGPGDYDIYHADLTNRGKVLLHGGQFKTQPSGREDMAAFEPDFLPLQQRKRYFRKKAVEDEKLEKAKKSLSKLENHASEHHISTNSMNSLLSDDETVNEEIQDISPKKQSIVCSLGGGGDKDRFDDKIYKREAYVKTSGMILSQDWDKVLNKKIPFSFQPPSHQPSRPIVKSEGADVDVDVGHLYSIVRSAQLSPIKFSAAFRSKAKVGMEIPVPTSGTIGPGAFPGADTHSLVVKNPDRPSHFILRGRPNGTRTPLPDLTEPIKSFAERHRAGPTFEKHTVGGGNVVLQQIVRNKMTKIYPKLAKSKFPPPPPPAPSPWARRKRK